MKSNSPILQDCQILQELSETVISRSSLVVDSTNRKMVLKIYLHGLLREARREFLFLKTVQDVGVITPIAYGEDEHPWLLTDYIEGEQVYQTDFPTLDAKNKFIARLSLSLTKIHNYGILLNDLKPANILICKQKPFIIDFGLSTVDLYQDEYFRGTLAYAAPEKIIRHTNHQASDIFSLGMILYYLSTGVTLIDQLGKDDYQRIIISEELWERCIRERVTDDYIRNMLSFNPQSRPSGFQVATSYAEKANLDIPELDLWQIQSYTFKSQIMAVEKLWSKRELTCQFADEPFRIENLLSLWSESKGRKLLILDEKKFISQPDQFFKSFPLGFRDKSVFRDLFMDWLKDQDVSLLLKRNRDNGTSSFFDELQEQTDAMVLWYGMVSEVKTVPQTEIRELIDQLQLTLNRKQSLLRQVKSSRPFTIRLILQENLKKSVSKKQENPLIELLQWMEIPIPVMLVERIWNNWYQLIQDGILKQVLRMDGDLVHLERGDKQSNLPASELLTIVMDAAQEEEQYYIVGQIHYLLGLQEKALEAWTAYVEDLTKKQYYFTAYEFLKQMRNLIPFKDYPFELCKKTAFISRIVGHFDEAMDIYSQLRKEADRHTEATLAVDQAIVLQSLNRYDDAIIIYNEAIQLFRESSNTMGMLRAMNNLGVVFFGLQRYYEAERIFNEVLHEARKNDNLQFETISYLNLADIHIKRADWNKCIFYSEKAIAITSKNQKWTLLVNGTLLGCRAMFATGESGKAIQRLESLLEDSRSKENPILTSEIQAWKLHFSIGKRNREDQSFYESLFDHADIDNEILLRELFFASYHFKHYQLAAQFAQKLPKLTILSAFLNSELEAIINRLLELKDQQEIDSYLYYSLQLGRAELLPFDHPFLSEMKEASELYLFEPLKHISSQTGHHCMIVSDEVETLWYQLSNSTDMEELITRTLHLLRKLTGMDRCIYFANQNKSIRPYLGVGRDGVILDLNEILLSQTLLQRIISNKNIQFYQNLVDGLGSDVHSSVMGLGLKNAVGCPIYFENELTGVFYVDSFEEIVFTEPEKQSLRIILYQIQSNFARLHYFQHMHEQNEVTDIDNSIKSSVQMIGSSKMMLDVHNRIQMIARYNVNVLIVGPTGSGKELVAKSIHEQFAQKNPTSSKIPFVVVNCAAIPEQLLESELFGYRKGAFTGAMSDKKGKIEAADHGTLFLDEIGEMPILLQAKLLRVIQEKVVTPLGSNLEIPVDVRIITATNQNLDDMVAKNSFRSDLYYRLKVVTIELPSLSDRKEDIPLLTHAFIRRFCEKFDKTISGIHPKVMQYLQHREWKGNIRELENTIERAVLLCQRDYLNLSDFLDDTENETTELLSQVPLVWQEYQDYKNRVIEDLDVRYVKHLLERSEDNIVKASKTGQLDRVQIYRLLKKVKS